MKLATGPWLPDQPDFGNPGLVRAENVIPAADHYLPFPSATALGAPGLTGQAEGMTVAFPTTGDPVLFTGFGGFLWRIPGLTVPPVNVSLNPSVAYTMNPGDRWRFVQYGDLALATNLNDAIQQFDISNLAGSFDDLTYAPRAKFLARIRDFVMLGWVIEDPDGEVPYRLRWHGLNTASGLPDLNEWTISLETRSDFQDISDIGEMTGLTGGHFGIALFRKGIARIDFGGQFLFEPAIVDDNIGCMVPGSVVRYGTETFFWSDEGIFKTNGGPASPVGTERVNRYLNDSLDIARFDDVWGYPDYGRGIIVWTLPVTAAAPSRLLVYRPALDRFSVVDVEVDSLGPTISFGLDLDDEIEWPDLDTDERNLDDPALWTGGILGLGGQIEDIQEQTATLWSETIESNEVDDDWASYVSANFGAVAVIEPTGSIANAPDSAPSLRANFQVGANYGFNVICEQLFGIPLQYRDAVTLRYDVYLDPAIDYLSVVNLNGSQTWAFLTFPGLVGGQAWPGPNNHAYPTGGEPTDDGWSARIRVAGSGKIGPYLYVQNKPGGFGWHRISNHALRLNDLRGSWSVWEQTCIMNTPGAADGQCILRINGETIVDVADLEYRPASKPNWVSNGIRLNAYTQGNPSGGALVEFDYWLRNFEISVDASDYDYPVESTRADLVSFTGSALQGVLEWSEMEPGDGQRFMVTHALAYHEGGSAQVVVRSREKQSGDGSNLANYGPFSPQSDGFFRFRVPGRFHRVRLLMNGDWHSVRGVDARGVPLGWR